MPNIETIPGFEMVNGVGSIGSSSSSSSSSLATQSFMYPPIGIFMVVSIFCLVAVVLLRPRLMKALRPGSGSDGKYQLLPTIREAS